MNPYIQLAIAIISSSAFSAVVTYILEKRRHKSGIELGVQMLLYTDIKEACEKFIMKGNISSEELEVLLKKHNVYHNNLKGNGYLDTLIAKVKALPIVND